MSAYDAVAGTGYSPLDPSSMGMSLPTDITPLPEPSLNPLASLHAELTARTPVNTNIPDSVKSYARKYKFQGDYKPLGSVIPNLPTPLLNTLLEMDQKRVERGQPVIGAEDTLAAINTVLRQQPVTPIDRPNPIRDLPNAIFRDAKAILTNLPKLPVELVKEAGRITQFSEEYEKQIAAGENTLSALAKSPGIRLLPGSFAAGEILSGDAENLLRHPLMAALDVAPYVGKGAKALRATEGYQQAAARAQESGLVQGAKTSRLYVKGEEAFGRKGRDTSYQVATALKHLADIVDPSQKIPDNWLLNADKHQIAQFNKAAQKFKETYSVIPEDRRAAITTAYQLGREEDIAALGALNDLETSFVADTRDITTRIQAYAVSDESLPSASSERVIEVPNIDNTMIPEVYHAKAANRILGARARVSTIEQLQPVRDLYESVHKRTARQTDRQYGLAPDELDLLRDRLASNTIEQVGRAQARLVADTTARILEAAGYGKSFAAEVTSVFQKKGKTNLATVIDGIRALPADQIPNLTPTRYARRQAFLDNQLSQFSAKTLRREQKLSAALERKLLPARFHPLMDRVTRDNLKAYVPDSDDAIRQAIEERRYDPLVEALGPDTNTVALIRKTQREAVQTVMRMRREGIANPIFMHRTSPDMAHLINFPTIRAHIVTPGQVKARTMDMTPHYDDFTVALPAQGVEWASRLIAEELAGTVASMWGHSQAALEAQFLPQARRLHSQRPSLDVQSHLSRLINNSFTKFDPTSVFPFHKGRYSGMPKGDIYIPKAVHKTLEDFFKTEQGFFTTATAPIMNAFRTSVLPLSPRWHVYNVLGGMVMMMAKTDPFTIWTKLGQARTMLKNPELVPDILRGELKNATLYQKELAFSRGGKFQEFVDLNASKVPGANQVRDKFGKLVQRSFDLNQFVDDMYRTMSYLYGHDKQLTKGMSREAAQRAGVELSRKIMPDWNSMTPIERNVIRGVLPFYGFMSHVLRYVYNYPIDHPIRASITSNFARAELDDMGEQTPAMFLGMFALPEFLGGGQDSKGEERYVNTAGWNPFSSVPDMFTFAGLIQSTNPLIGTALASVGIDPMSGESSLYPDVKYDRETGRLGLKSKNPLANLFAASLPQVNMLAQLANPSSELNRLRASDPDVAERIQRAALGLPNLVRKRNLSAEQMKGELNRREALRRQVAQAVKQGAGTTDNPVGQAYIGQLQQLLEANPSALTPYTRDAARQSIGVQPADGREGPGQGAIGEAQRILLGTLGLGE